MSTSNEPQSASDRPAKATVILPAVLGNADAARYLGLSPHWLNQLRSRGSSDQPRYHKVGKRVLYRIADLDDWLAQHLQVIRAAA